MPFDLKALILKHKNLCGQPFQPKTGEKVGRKGLKRYELMVLWLNEGDEIRHCHQRRLVGDLRWLGRDDRQRERLRCG